MQIEIGTTHAVNPARDEEGKRVTVLLEGEHTTSISVPEDYDLGAIILTVKDVVDRHHARDAKPAWIECSDAATGKQLLSTFGLTAAKGRRPAGWGIEDYPGAAAPTEAKPKRTRKAKAPTGDALTSVAFLVALAAMVFAFLATRLSLRTAAGVDWTARVMGDTSSNGSGSYAPGNWMAVSEDAGAPNTASTSLPGEIVAGTLVRKQCAYAHTNGTDFYTLTAVFTFDDDVTLAKFGIFNAAAAGTLVFETLLTAVVVGLPGDQVAITDTITL